MAADRSYVDANRAALDRLKGFVEKASDADLAHPMEDGWTVASVLAHAAFWDLRVVACVDAWGPDGSGPVPTYYDDAVDWINDAAKPLISALEPRVAARVTVEAAEAADQSGRRALGRAPREERGAGAARQPRPRGSPARAPRRDRADPVGEVMIAWSAAEA